MKCKSTFNLFLNGYISKPKALETKASLAFSPLSENDSFSWQRNVYDLLKSFVAGPSVGQQTMKHLCSNLEAGHACLSHFHGRVSHSSPQLRNRQAGCHGLLHGRRHTGFLCRSALGCYQGFPASHLNGMQCDSYKRGKVEPRHSGLLVGWLILKETTSSWDWWTWTCTLYAEIIKCALDKPISKYQL